MEGKDKKKDTYDENTYALYEGRGIFSIKAA